MPLPDDHDKKWIYKKHTRAKHDVLHYYLSIWASIVSQEKYSLRIFDCFAGRGNYVKSEGGEGKPLEVVETDVSYPGSPLIMMDALSKHREHFKSAECYLLEPNNNNREILKENVQQAEIPEDVNPHIKDCAFPDDINDVIAESGGSRGFAFFFIDPFNIKYLDYDTICKIAKIQDYTGGFETFITLMTGQLIRWQSSDSHKYGYDTLYGTPNWREQLQDYSPRYLETREAEFYCERLRESGPKETIAYMVTEGDSKRLKYHLVFTSNNSKGIQYMKESMERCGTDYALAFAPERPEKSHQQVNINQYSGGELLSEEETAKSYLLSKFAGETLTVDQVIEQSIVERRYDPSIRRDYRKYIKELHDEGEIEIPDRDSSSLPDNLRVVFPNDD